MKKFEFGVDNNNQNQNELSISNKYTLALREKYSMLFPEQYVPNFYRVLFRSMAIVLKHYEDKNTPKIGFSLLNDRGDFVIGAILAYQAPEEGEEDSGNWNLSFTLNKEDLSDVNKLIDSHSDNFYEVASAELYAAMFGRFETATAMNQMYTEAIAVLIKFLDDNSGDSEEIEIELPGIVTASVGFEEGAKVYSIVPGATVKQIVKNDASLSK